MSSEYASATLTGSLLASKGAAAPSNSVYAFLEELPASQQSLRNHSKITPTRIAEVATKVLVADSQPAASSSEIAGGRAKLSVRLDPDRHLKLKLAAAHLRRSSQAIMLEALDAYLSSIRPSLDPACPCLNDDG